MPQATSAASAPRTEVNILKTDDHYDLLETDPSRVEAAAFQHEQLQERDEENGLTLNMPIGTALALASQLSELQQLVAQTHAQAKAEGATEEQAIKAAAQVKEVEQELKQTQAELIEAEREAAQKLEIRQKLREQAKGASSSGSSASSSAASSQAAPVEREDFSHIEALFQVETQDQDVLRDLAARQQEIVARHQAALESRTWLDRTKDICLTGVEVLKELGREIRDNPIGFAGAVAYEAGDLVTPGGIDAPAEWLRGQRGFGSMMARQSANIAAEAAMLYVGAKALKGLKAAGKGLGVLKRFTSKAMAKVEEKAGSKAAAESAKFVQKELEALTYQGGRLSQGVVHNSIL